MAITRRRDGAQLHDADDQRRRAPADAQLSQSARRKTHDRHRAARAVRRLAAGRCEREWGVLEGLASGYACGQLAADGLV